MHQGELIFVFDVNRYLHLQANCKSVMQKFTYLVNNISSHSAQCKQRCMSNSVKLPSG